MSLCHETTVRLKACPSVMAHDALGNHPAAGKLFLQSHQRPGLLLFLRSKSKPAVHHARNHLGEHRIPLRSPPFSQPSTLSHAQDPSSGPRTSKGRLRLKARPSVMRPSVMLMHKIDRTKQDKSTTKGLSLCHEKALTKGLSLCHNRGCKKEAGFAARLLINFLSKTANGSNPAATKETKRTERPKKRSGRFWNRRGSKSYIDRRIRSRRPQVR